MVWEEGHDQSRGVLLVNARPTDQLRACEYERISIPKSSDQPFNGFDGRHEPQSTARQAQEGVHLTVQLLVLGRGELCPVLALALFAEYGGLEARKASIELTELLEALEAGGVESLVTLGGSDSGFPYKRLGVGGFLGLNVEGGF